MKIRIFFSILFICSTLALMSCRDYEMIQAALQYHTTQLKDAEYVGSETCAMCHEEIHRDSQMATHQRVTIPAHEDKETGEMVGDFTIEGCEMCHGPASKHVDAADGSYIINPGKDANACFACHMEKKAEFRMPHHHPVLEGHVACTDCHSPHGKEVSPAAMTSLTGTNETCFQCHKEQRGPFVWKHEALEEGCTTCHTVHGSINDKMLIARDSNLCLRCHAQADHPTIGNSGHGGRLPEGTCFSAGCHTAVHGSNFDEHLRY